MLCARLQRKNSRAVCSHEPCNIRSNNILADQVLKRAQDGIVVKCPALYDNMVAKRRDILELHDLEQCVLDNRERNACRDIGDFCPLLLRLFDF